MKEIKPSIKEIRKYLDKWDTLENYVLQERSLIKLFTQTYPLNNNIDDVLIKVSSLNDFYSTNIFSTYTVAKHIVKLDIDSRLLNEDLNLVAEIAHVILSPTSERNFYSFATKYCSQHKPFIYPIYDNFVGNLLIHLTAKDNFFKFEDKDLKNYPKYKNILHKFQKYYKLEECSFKEIDKYLWLVGKELSKSKSKKR